MMERCPIHPDGPVGCLDCMAQEASERIADLEGELDDWREGARRVMAEECAPDERHCTCVPVLRKKIAELERERDELLAVVREVVYQMDDENGPGNVEYFVEPAREIVERLDRTGGDEEAEGEEPRPTPTTKEKE